MISNVCKIEKGTNGLAEILSESEKVAVYNGLDKKQSLQLRLICEEMDGMLPKIIDDFNGDLWIEFNKGVCKVNVCIDIPELNSEKKDELIKVSKSKKNALAVGIVGKIRSVIEDFFLREKAGVSFNTSSGEFYSSTGLSFSYLWTLNGYKENATDKETEKWDELEKSIIANLADDVIVGVKGKKATIVAIKNFK